MFARYVDFYERNYFNIEDELIKLFCLIITQTHFETPNEEFLSKKYIVEKIGRLCRRERLSLDEYGKKIFDILTRENNPKLYLLNKEEIINFYQK